MEDNHKVTIELEESEIVKEKNEPPPECSDRNSEAGSEVNKEPWALQESDWMTFAFIKSHKEFTKPGIKQKWKPQPGCCIYKVNEDLRKINEGAYTPRVVSIGPFHYGKKSLLDMEEEKIRYLTEFSQRITADTCEVCINFIKEKEVDIRNCYMEIPTFETLEFVMMILHDAIFIIEYLLRACGYLKCEEDVNDYLLRNRPLRDAIWRDLLLLENQIPYFVLEKLYNEAVHNKILHINGTEERYPSFMFLCVIFCGDDLISKPERLKTEEVEAKHFTDIRRYLMTKMKLDAAVRYFGRELFLERQIPCVVKLNESGLKFKTLNEECCLVDIRFEKKKLLRIPGLKLEVSELQIPPIEIHNETECLLRNVMAWEQCHYPRKTDVCNYVYLMDCLINTEEDVNLLVEAEIIDNRVGDTAKIAKMFNELCTHISCSNSRYRDVVKGLNAHYKSRWNHNKTTLIRVYFSNPWRGTGTVAAIVLLFLTLVQTICSMVQVL